LNAGGVMKGWLSNRSLLKNSVAVAHSRYIIGSFKRRWQHRSYMNKSFLSCDWGTSSFRLRLIDVGSGMPAGESVSDEGIGWAMKRSCKRVMKKTSGYHFIVPL